MPWALPTPTHRARTPSPAADLGGFCLPFRRPQGAVNPGGGHTSRKVFFQQRAAHLGEAACASPGILDEGAGSHSRHSGGGGRGGGFVHDRVERSPVAQAYTGNQDLDCTERFPKILLETRFGQIQRGLTENWLLLRHFAGLPELALFICQLCTGL